jgi:gamma-glutamyltranspeptidase / glutathione hydrolase
VVSASNSTGYFNFQLATVNFLREARLKNLRQKIATLLIAALSATATHADSKPVHAPHAIVVSIDELASKAGADIMQVGGNAIDAAVATGFVLAVVYPQAGNIGGGGFMLLRMADGKTHFIDFREEAPAAATAGMYLDAQGNVIPDASEYGYKAIGVPGSVAGLVYAQKKYGKLSLRRVMAPAILLALNGFELSWQEARDLREASHLADFPESRRIFQRNGNFYKQYENFRQPELARTLQRISRNPEDFYRGAMAQELAAAIQKGGGLLTAQDLAHYQVKEREPLRGTYRGYEVISAPPPSSGGTVLIETLNILEGYDLAKAGSRSAESVHLTAEAFRRAFFDRAEFLGDPDFTKLPIAQLTDKKYAEAWRATIDSDHATASKDLQRPAIFSTLAQADRQQTQESQPIPPRESPHTTHYSVVDADGNAVAVTTTINDWFGSRVTATGLGFILNDEMDDFSAKPGAPNGDGLIQGAANSIGPGKRPLSSMTPTIVLKDGKLFLVLGSPGSSRIITTVALAITGVVDYGMNIQEAIDAPRFHQQWMPDVLSVEAWFAPDAVHALEKMGYKIIDGLNEDANWSPHWSDGECIAIDPKTNERLGASDGRSNGKPVGY